MTLEHFYTKYFIHCNGVTIDSRNVQKNDIFFALQGTQVDSNTFAKSAIEKGAIAAIVYDENFEQKENSILYVKDSLQFLQELAIHHRNQLSIPIIALTGSNGKTTTKELIATVLKEKFQTLYTKGNLNNHIGVPLTLLSIKPNHEVAVVEMGANHQKEIEFLCTIAQPDFGYITNFGKAHLEGFGGEEGVIKGKSELIEYLRKHQKIILVNENDSKQVELTHGMNQITFGTENSDYYFTYKTQNETHFLDVEYQKQFIHSNLTGEYNFSNVSVAIALGFHFQITFEAIKNGIETYFPNNHRSQIIEKNQKTIVMDAYNANPSSMEVALKNFSQFSGTKTIILGDMFELGISSEIEHKNIVDLAKRYDFDQIILIGSHFAKLSVEKNIHQFETREIAEAFIVENRITSQNILIKGSRGMALEKILDIL